MCGIFAFTGPGPPDPDTLAAAADGAAQRGPHGHGWVTSDTPGDLEARYRLGSLSTGRGALAAVKTVTAARIVGHARLATASDGADPDALQPVVVDGHAFAHNGHVYNLDALTGSLGGLANNPIFDPDDPANLPSVATDSCALARMYAVLRRSTDPAGALTDLVRVADQNAWAIVVLDRTGGLYTHRYYHPLYWWRVTEPAGCDRAGRRDGRPGPGVYLSSQRRHPSARLVPEDQPVAVEELP